MAGNLGRIPAEPSGIPETTTPPETKNRTPFKKAPVCLSDGAIRQ